MQNITTIMITRLIYKDLVAWKNSKNKKPMILRGARQTGKTTLVNHFGQAYDNYLYFNLDTDEDKQIFESINDIETLVQSLFLNRNKRLNNGSTLVFIDEIQESVKAIGQLRYFYEKIKGIDVIAAGSLLEFALKDSTSFPVGRVSYLKMHPMNFIEFLYSLKLDQLVEMLDQIPIPEFALDKLFAYFHKFAIIGGMPEVVSNYSLNEDISSTSEIFDSLLISYRDDIVKYASNKKQTEIINHIFENAPLIADSRITFANFGNSNYRSDDVKNAMLQLQKAYVLQLIYPINVLKPPAIPNKKLKPRLQFLDTGLMNYSLGIQAELLLLTDLNDGYRGKIIQHLLIQEVQSVQTSPLFQTLFWVREKKTSNAEIDLIWQYGNLLIPVEIKSGKAGKLRSLMQFIDNCDHHYAVRFYKGPVKIDNIVTLTGKSFKLLNIPYFLGTKLHLYVAWFVDNN